MALKSPVEIKPLAGLIKNRDHSGDCSQAKQDIRHRIQAIEPDGTYRQLMKIEVAIIKLFNRRLSERIKK